jgi:hypothetical protein
VLTDDSASTGQHVRIPSSNMFLWLRVYVGRFLGTVIGPACFPTIHDYIESRSACIVRFSVLTDVFSAQFSALNVALTRLESLEDLDRSGILLCLVKVGFPFD